MIFDDNSENRTILAENCKPKTENIIRFLMKTAKRERF
ncbi:hypothetical protein T06_650 [Trichinella sp. T6]|nr:hypothetical protein T06_650 [Trichinella sp. T6]